MATTQTTPSDNLLLKLFEDHVKQLLYQSLRPEMDRLLKEEIDKAVSSMQTSLMQEFSHYDNAQMVKIILEDKRK